MGCDTLSRLRLHVGKDVRKLAQLVERRFADPNGVGSNPARFTSVTVGGLSTFVRSSMRDLLR